MGTDTDIIGIFSRLSSGVDTDSPVFGALIVLGLLGLLFIVNLIRRDK